MGDSLFSRRIILRRSGMKMNRSLLFEAGISQCRLYEDLDQKLLLIRLNFSVNLLTRRSRAKTGLETNQKEG